MRVHTFASLLVVVVATGCGSSASKTTSTVSGTAALTTFPAAPISALAVDETGHAVGSTIAADGRFSLTLTKGHRYRLAFAADSEVPVVLPRATGKLNLMFRLSTGGARLELGSVRYFASAPEGGFRVLPGSKTQQPTSATTSGPDEECVDGLLAGTSTPCVDDDGKTTCDDGSEGSDGDGECIDGKDALTGAVCSDPPESGDDADPASAMAVPDRNVPEDVGGCQEGEDGETNDD